MSQTIDQVSLFYRDGSSHKEYHAQLVEVAGGCMVHFQFGRVGSTLQTGSKTPAPVDRDKAKKIYDRLVSEKTAKGYQVGGGGTSYVATAAPTVSTAERLIPQLLCAIDEGEVERLLRDDRYGAQEKKDGRHQMIAFKDGACSVYNKKGKEIGYPKEWVGALPTTEVILDGEAIGDTYHVFDLLNVAGADIRSRGYGDRFARLSQISFGASIVRVPLATGCAAKRALYDRLMKEKREGIVFKLLSASYTPGRPSSGGSMLKHKFYSTLSAVVVAGREGKRSVGLELIDSTGRRVFVGNVTIPQNKDIPLPLDVVEIKYLYAYEGGSLYQPIYLGLRDDTDIGECLMTQVKYKSEAE